MIPSRLLLAVAAVAAGGGASACFSSSSSSGGNQASFDGGEDISFDVTTDVSLGMESGTEAAPPVDATPDVPASSDAGGDAGIVDAAADAPVDAGPVVLANDVPNASYIATDGTWVYWIDWFSDDAGVTNGRVMKIPVGGGAEVTIADSPHGSLGGFVVDSTHAYWIQGYPADIYSTPLSGGASTQLTSGGVVFSILRQDTDNLYWPQWPITYNAITQTPKDGGPSTPLTGNLGAPPGGSGPAYGAMVVTQGQVVWLADCCDAVMSVPVDGGAVATLVSEGPDAGSGENVNGSETLATDGTNLYWETQAGGNYPTRIMKAPVVGGAATALVDAGTSGNVGSVATDGISVYYLDNSNTPAAIVKVPVGGGTPVTLTTSHVPGSITLGSKSNGPFITVDSTSVYWLNTFGASEIVKMPK